MSFLVRRMVIDDTDPVLQLIKEEALFHDQLQYVKTSRTVFIENAFSANPRFGVFVAELDGELIGYVSYRINFSIWAGSDFMNIDDVFVTEACRGMRIGRELMTYAKETALSEGLSMSRWEVEVNNQNAIRFYKNLGATYKEKGILNWVF